MSNTTTPEPKLDGKRLVRAKVNIEPIEDYAQVNEILFFAESKGDGGAGTVSKFIHGMDKKSMVTNFEAKVYNPDNPNIPDFIIKAKCKEKEKARAEFKRAIHEGKEAILGETDAVGDNFVISLGAIKKEQLVQVEFSYLVVMNEYTKVTTTQGVQHVDVEVDKSYELMLPVSFKPKYSPNPGGDPLFITGASATKMEPDSAIATIHSRHGNIHRIINVATDQPERLEHGPQINDNKQNFEYYLNGDVHLRIYYKNVPLPNVSGNHGQRITQNIEINLFKFEGLNKINDQDNPLNGKYGLIVEYYVKQNMLYSVPKNQFPKRTFHFVIDCSGSMRGDFIRFSKDALIKVLNLLPSNGTCFVNITKFGSHHQNWKDIPVRYDEEQQRAALNFAQQIEADLGGTNLNECLKYVLETQNEPEYKKQVIVLTDAAIDSYTNTIDTVQNSYRGGEEDPNNRVFVLGIGHGVSKSLCDELATAGGGKSAFVLDSAGIKNGVNQLLGYTSRKAG